MPIIMPTKQSDKASNVFLTSITDTVTRPVRGLDRNRLQNRLRIPLITTLSMQMAYMHPLRIPRLISRSSKLPAPSMIQPIQQTRMKTHPTTITSQLMTMRTKPLPSHMPGFFIARNDVNSVRVREKGGGRKLEVRVDHGLKKNKFLLPIISAIEMTILHLAGQKRNG